MPIYEYQCCSCSNTFEKLTFQGDRDTIECPCCGARDVKKLLSAGSFMSGGSSACSATAPKGFS